MGLTESSFQQSLIESECFSQIKCSSKCNNCIELDVENENDNSSTLSSPRTIIDSYKTIPPDEFVPINESNHRKTR